MKQLWLALLIVPLILTGCARHYVITLNNGTRITTKGKPKLQGNSYRYTDARGNPASVGVSRVADVAPASMTKQAADPFKPKPSR